MTPAGKGFDSVGSSGYSANWKRGAGRGTRSGLQLQTCAWVTEEGDEGRMQEMEEGYDPSSVMDCAVVVVEDNDVDGDATTALSMLASAVTLAADSKYCHGFGIRVSGAQCSRRCGRFPHIEELELDVQFFEGGVAEAALSLYDGELCRPARDTPPRTGYNVRKVGIPRLSELGDVWGGDLLSVFNQINRLNVSLFTPPLLFCVVAFYLTLGALGNTDTVHHRHRHVDGRRTGSGLDIQVEEIAAYARDGGQVQLRSKHPLVRRHHIFAWPATISSTTRPPASIVGLDANTDRDVKRMPLLVDFATCNDDDWNGDREGEDSEHDLRMHASSSTLVHSHSHSSASALKKRVAGQFTKSPMSSAPSSPRIMLSGIPGALGATSLLTTIARNGKNPQAQHTRTRTPKRNGNRRPKLPLGRRNSTSCNYTSPPSSLPSATYILHPLRMLPTALLYAAPLSLIVTLTPSLQYVLEHNRALWPMNGAVTTCGNSVVLVKLVVLWRHFGGGEEGEDADTYKDGDKKKKGVKEEEG
ncbi:hypothetical protein CVT25_002482 [Psilocybe cyanescens]|uniref:Uncharacterized protein n=1 Tax=Psilocybe cyanescens TaxID=93625 RepID=A0A409X4I6_PSICY|nr:hypothetical protein CVT25_002482 [Psilocybe cyanescens]